MPIIAIVCVCVCVCETKLYIGPKNHFGITKDSIFWKVGIDEAHIEELSNMVETVFVFNFFTTEKITTNLVTKQQKFISSEFWRPEV